MMADPRSTRLAVTVPVGADKLPLADRLPTAVVSGGRWLRIGDRDDPCSTLVRLKPEEPDGDAGPWLYPLVVSLRDPWPAGTSVRVQPGTLAEFDADLADGWRWPW